MAEFSDIRDQVGNAMSQALAGESEMVTRWVAIVEVMGADGGRAAYVMAPDGTKTWDSLGLLMFAMQIEQAAAVQDIEDDDDDD